MNSEQKMREAFEKMAAATGVSGYKNTVTSRFWFEHGYEAALANHAGEQVGLTDAEILEVLFSTAGQSMSCVERVRAVIAAHEAKRNWGA